MTKIYIVETLNYDSHNTELIEVFDNEELARKAHKDSTQHPTYPSIMIGSGELVVHKIEYRYHKGW